MPHRILLVAKRDYVATVMTKAFVIGLVLAPLMFGGGFFGIALMRVTQGGKDRRIALIDHTGAAAAAVMQAAQEKDSNAKSLGPLAGSHYVFEPIEADDQDPTAQRLALSDRIRHGELFAFVEIGSRALHPAREIAAGDGSNRIVYYTNTGGLDAQQSQQWLTESINNGLRRVRLAQLGVDRDHFDEVLSNVAVQGMNLVSRDEKTGIIQEARRSNPIEGFAVPFILMMLMLLIVMVGSAPMLSAVAEDKIQRVFEMLLASTTPFELIAGKVLAAVGRSLTSSVFYVLGGILALQGMAMIGVVPFRVLPWFFIYLIGEVTMLSALGAALGAACNTPRDAQSLAPIMIMPVMLPIFLLVPLLQQPNGLFATVVSLIPPFTPLIMVMRMAMPGGVPAWEPWAGLAGVLACTLLITWAAARIFRVAILLQGKPPRIAEMVRWAVRG